MVWLLLSVCETLGSIPEPPSLPPKKRDQHKLSTVEEIKSRSGYKMEGHHHSKLFLKTFNDIANAYDMLNRKTQDITILYRKNT